MIKAVILDCFGVVLDIMRGTKIQQTLDLIEDLRPDYKLGMLTNVPSRYSLDQRFDPGQLDAMFEVVIASGEVGWDKPAPEIFIMAAERIGVKPEECLFIDDIPAFCAAAEAIGMKSFAYVNNPESITAIKKILKDDKSK